MKKNNDQYFRGGVKIPSENYRPKLGDKKIVGRLTEKRIYIYVRRLDEQVTWVEPKDINVSPKQRKYMIGLTDVNPDTEYWAKKGGWWDGGQRMPKNQGGGLEVRYVKYLSQLTS